MTPPDGGELLAAALVVVTSGAIWVAAGRAAGAIVPAAEGVLDRLAVGILLALVEVVVVLEALGAIGVLQRWTAAGAAVALAIAALRLPRPARLLRGPVPQGWRVVAVCGAPFAALAVAWSLAGPSREADTAQYHVVNAAQWLRTGSTWSLPYAIPGDHTAADPGNGEIVSLWLMLPSHTDDLACLAVLAFAALCVAATAMVARELGGEAWLGGLAGLVAVAAPASFATQAHSMLTDLLAAGGVVAGVAFALRARRSVNVRTWALLAGAAVGLGVGSKYSALGPAVAAIVALAILLPARRRWSALLWALGATVMVGGFWYARNLVQAGNPIFPEEVSVFGHRLMAGTGDPTGHRVSLLSQLLHLRSEVAATWVRLVAYLLGPGVVVLVVGGLLSGRGRGDRRRTQVVVTLLAGAALLAYAATPLTGGGVTGDSKEIGTDLRFILPAALIAAGAAAATMPRRLLGLVLGLGVVYDLGFALAASRYRDDLPTTLGPLLTAAIATTGALLLVRLPAARWPRLRAPSAATAAVIVALTLAAHRTGPGRDRDPARLVLERAAADGQVVAVVGVADMRTLLGPHLDLDPVGVGTGTQGALRPIDGVSEFNAMLRRLRPAAIAVGALHDAAPPGWMPPPPYRSVGREGDAVVYAATG